jgi:ankyrin repeat protein
MIKDISIDAKKRYQSFGIKGNTKRFKMACLAGRLDIMHYLLTSLELAKNVDIHTADDFALRIACKKGFLEIVTYLLESPELMEHADIAVYNGIVFKHARENGHLDVVHYLEQCHMRRQLALHGTNNLLSRLRSGLCK